MSPHPLDDEDVLVTVTLLHRPTGCSASKNVMAPADAKPDVFEASEEATEGAMDALLAKLETQGG